MDEVFAKALGAEDALVRHNFVSGTHALTVALFGVLRPGDTMLSVTGIPYDTLRGVLGITGDGNGSLKEFGIHYEQLDLKPDGTPDYEAMETAIACTVSVLIEATIATVEATEAALRTFSASKAAGSAEHLL